MAADATEDSPDASPADATRLDDLQVQIEVLEAENRRLRATYAHIRRTRHRRTALGLAALGAIAIAGAALFPAGRTVLVVLGAIGLFGGLLTWYLTPERFVAADVGERVYTAQADSLEAIAAELGLAAAGWYVPVPDAADRDAVLYLPQFDDGDTPPVEALTSTFVVPDDSQYRGLALRPTGDPLLEALREATPGGLAADATTLVDQLADGLCDQFELVESARPDVDPAAGRVSMAVAGSAYGEVDRFDHPVASLLGTGLAVGMGFPIAVDVDRMSDGRGEFLVTARWEPDDGSEPNAAAEG